MTTTEPTIITLDDDTQIIEPGFVKPEDLSRIIQEGVFPSPLKIEEEPLDETNRNIPGRLILSPSGQLLKQYITWEGFGDHHIEVYDNWIFRSAYNNVYDRMLRFPDGRTICFENLKIFNPRYTRDGKVLPLTPKLAREQGVTYGGDWHVDVVLRRAGCGSEELDRRSGICIGTVPTMLKSHHCILHGKTPRELALLGEDPKDPGGYYIISGVEKVVLLQELLAVNKIFLMNMDSKGSPVARMTVNTTRGTALIELALDKKTHSIIKMRFPSMRGSKQGAKYKSLNVLRIFRFFGREDPREIQNIIGMFMKPEHQKKSMFKLTRNLVDFMMFPDDVEIITAKMDKSKLEKLERGEKVREILKIFETDLFPHLNNLPGPDNETVQERDDRVATAKISLLAIMIARFLEHLAGFRPLDNRDSWSNKRVEGGGRMMEQLFRNAWRKTLGIIQASIETGGIKDLGGVVEKMRYSVITDTFHDSFITSNWGVKGTQMKNNVAQTLVRDSVTATFAHINTVDVSISRTDRQQSLRMVQNDQWGFVDSVSTPEGENCLAQGTLVFNSSGQAIDIAQVKDGDVMLSINPQTYELIETPVIKCFTKSSQQHGKGVYNVTTYNGKTITATGDHKFLTARGFVDAEHLKPNCDHLCVTYAPTPYFNSCETIIPLITKDFFIENITRYGIRHDTALKYSEELEQKNYLTFMNNDARMPIIARMIGFLTADGNITVKNGYPALTGYFGCIEDADDFRADAIKLGFEMKPSHYSEYQMEESGTQRKITHHIHRIEYTGALAALLMVLGVKSGRKTTQPSERYLWLDNVSKLSRREFLAGLMGGDGGAIRVSRGSSYRINHFTQSKHPEYLESGHQFMQDIMELFEEFDVEVVSIKEEIYAQGITLRMDFSQSCDNIIRYMYNVGFRYCRDKLTRSLQITEYLKYRECVINEKNELKRMIIQLHNQGMTPKTISTHLGIDYNEVSNICRRKCRSDINVLPKDAWKFDQWCQCTSAINGCIFIPIKSVTPAQDCLVCDYTTVADTHTIICANGIVSHNCGILKNLCITAKVSLERSDSEIIRLLIGDQAKGIVQRVSMDLRVREQWPDKLIVNGKFLGWCDGEETRRFLVGLRRNGALYFDMSVIKEDDWLYVDIGPSRLVRPLLIVDPDSQQLAIDSLGLRGQPNHILLTSGAMEYISAWEQEYIKVATSVDVIRRRSELIEDANDTFRVAADQLAAVGRGERIEIEVEGIKTELTPEEAQSRYDSAKEAVDKLRNNRPYTHCELDPQAILGVAAALIPWPNHNQAPRNTYQVSMGKQALGVYHSNHLNRFDGKTKLLAFPNRPIVETEMYDVIGLDERCPGENVNIAFMAFPYTEEDSFVVKKEFLDNGGFRIYKYLTYKTIVKLSGEVTETLTKPELRAGEPLDRYKYIQMAEPGNPMNGLPMIGAPLKQGDCVIGKIQHVPATKDVRNESVILRVGDEGVVDKVLVTSDNKTTVVTVKLRVMRIPQEGDKFAPRNAQKATIGLVMSDIDLPVSQDGLTPDFIVNVHCFTADTPVLLKNGLSRPLTSMKYNGGDKVWSFDKDIYKFVSGTSMGHGSNGIKDIVKVTLSDGRIIRCTPDHKFPVLEQIGSLLIRKTLPVNQITKDHIFLAGIDGVIDAPTPEERQQELLWSLTTEEYSFNMNTEEERDKSLAFARLLGLICTDGCISNTTGYICGNVVIGSQFDAEVVLDDIELITGKRPAVTSSHSDIGGNTLTIMLPRSLSKSVGSLDGMTIGRRTTKVPEWPSFVFDEHCPKSVIREFLAGLFSGDGWAPYLVTNTQDGQGTVTFNAPAISQSSIITQWDELVEKMEDVGHLLDKVGVPGARIDKPKIYNNGDTEMIRCNLQLPRGIEFGDKVGFRYCVQKMYRMAVYQSYMRYLSNVKRQNDIIISRASEIYDNEMAGRSLQRALDMARIELFTNESPFNDYYSYATLDQLRNRRRKDLFKQLMKWDYNHIEDADKYLRKIGAYHWFHTEEGTGGADYIVKQDTLSMPYFCLKLHDIRSIGTEEVFDLGIHITHFLTVNGVAASNSMPSRMTMSYPMELLAAKYGAYKGVHVNGGAFKPFELNLYREVLRSRNKNEFGYEKMRSGTSGKLLQADIYAGPVFFQALKHHVKDKVQVRSTGQVKPMTRQPPKGRGNKGGLRFGKHFADVVNKITAGPRRRGQRDQIQGNSQMIYIYFIVYFA